MGGQPLHVPNVKAMVDHMNPQANFWNDIIDVGQVNSTVSSKKTTLSNVSSISNSYHNLQNFVTFFLGTSLLGTTIGLIL